MRLSSRLPPPLRRYADFRGRSRRREFWRWVLLALAAWAVLGRVEAWLGWRFVAGLSPPVLRATPVQGYLTGPLLLGCAVPTLAVAVRRLHDSDRRGWWLLLPVAAVAAVVALVVSLVLAGGGEGGEAALGFVILLVPLGAVGLCLALLCLPGTTGRNRFGPDPKDPAGAVDLAEVFR